MTQISCVSVIGAGQMGSGIAQVAACYGNHQVIVQDISDAALAKSKAGIEKSLNKLVEKGKIDQAQVDGALSKMNWTTDIESLAPSELVIEAVVEDLEIKQSLFARLDQILEPQAVLASNTSSLSIAQMALMTSRPSQVVGMHFMNPVPLMPLVEVIESEHTSAQTTELILYLARLWQKTPVKVRDVPGFVGNRVLFPLINEAAWALHDGVASAKDIDTVMTLGMNHPMGPLALADFIGLDTCLAILNVLSEGVDVQRFKPCPLFAQYVAEGRLGKKSGRGFFDYA